MIRIANQHTRPGQATIEYARLVNPAGPLDGRRVRVHVFFPAAGAGLPGHQRRRRLAARLALFLVVVAAVAVRETARLLVAAWLGLRLRAVLLLPIGGLFAYANPESQESANQGGGQFAMALCRAAGQPGYGAGAGSSLSWRQAENRSLHPPLITSAYLLRSLVWMQVGLGVCTCCRPIRWILAACCAAALRASTGLRRPAAPRQAWDRSSRWRHDGRHAAAQPTG